VVVILLCLLFAAQVLIGLYARSVLTAAAFDAARSVAGAGATSDPGAVARAEDAARSRLGGFGRQVVFVWREIGPDRVVLEVRARTPAFLPVRLETTSVIDRTVIVRVERFR
jgi:Flp pilus assembly protein TadG